MQRSDDANHILLHHDGLYAPVHGQEFQGAVLLKAYPNLIVEVLFWCSEATGICEFMTTMYFLQEFLLVLWFLSKIVSSINEGILQFSHSSLIVHENQRRVQLTVTRTCSESLLGYCSGSISVAYSPETKPTVRLPGNLVVRQGSAVVYSTTDLRRFLGRGDTLRLVDNTSRKMKYLDTTSIVCHQKRWFQWPHIYNLCILQP